MAPRADIPVTILGGYLGAGNTTRINQLLATNQAKRIGVVVNDFGAVNIDAHLINQRGESTIGLSNGCVCCTLADGLGAALDTLAASEPPIEWVVVEASGVAKPQRIAAYAQTWPGFRLAGVVVVVDATRIVEQMTDKYIGATVRDQIRAAHRIIISHADCAPEQADEATRVLVGYVRNDTTVVLNGLQDHDWILALQTDPSQMHPGAYDDESSTHEAHHQTATIESSEPLNAQGFRALARAAPTNLIRVKGWVHLDDAPEIGRQLQAVPGRWTLTPDPTCPVAPGRSQLVVVWTDNELSETHVRALFFGS